ncbi:MAG TPA: hypothetical protein VFO79_04030 [Xanthomonadales bacterium]|nr:hypothetical protein [Xanthomonadales bacterium]
MLQCRKSIHAVVAAFALALGLSGCGRDDAPAEEAAAPAADTATAADSAPVVDAAPVGVVAPPSEAYDRPLEVADIDAYARGVQWEIGALGPKVDAVKAAREKKDDAAETMALLALATPLDEDAARAAGIPPERYRHVRQAIDQIVAARQMGQAMQPQIAAMEQMDTSTFTEEQKAQAAQNLADMKTTFGDPYAKLAPDVAAAMKAREAELDKLRNDALALRLSVL